MRHSDGTEPVELVALFNVFHLRDIAGLCFGLFVGIANGDDVVQFVVGRNVEPVKEEICTKINNS